MRLIENHIFSFRAFQIRDKQGGILMRGGVFLCGIPPDSSGSRNGAPKIPHPKTFRNDLKNFERRKVFLVNFVNLLMFVLLEDN